MALDPVQEKLLHAYVDGELSLEKILETEKWIQESVNAQAEVKKIQTLKKKLNFLTPSDLDLPASLTSRLQQTIAELQKPTFSASLIQEKENILSKRRFPWSWAVAAAILFLAFYLPFESQSSSNVPQFLSYAQKSHQSFVQAGRPEVLTTDLKGTIHKFNRYLQTNLSEHSLRFSLGQFKGWCNCRIEGIQDARRLAYEVEGTPVSLYILRNSTDLPCPEFKIRRSGERLYLTGICGNYRVVKWQSGVFSYFLVSAFSEDRMIRLMDEVQF